MLGALEGITVVALEQAVAAPFASARLADAGARVIKLERPEGDFARGYDAYVHGQSSYFVWLNRGKESCLVDLKTAEDRALVEAMLSTADVFIQNLAPGATGRLGLGSAELMQRYPNLIVCDVSGYAPGTPDYTRKAYDLLIQAEAGLAGITGSEESGPTRVGISIGDISTGQAAYAAILEALLRRGRTGKGSHIQVSLFDTIADYMNVPYLAHRYANAAPKRQGLAHPSIAPYGVFSASDGDILVAIQNEREWLIFCEAVIGDAGMAIDPRFADNRLRVSNREALERVIQEHMARSTIAELGTRMDEARIAYGLVSTMAGLMVHRSATTTLAATPEGDVEFLASPVLVDGCRISPGPVPALGQHDAALRSEFQFDGSVA